eukprot:TRINITY_DN32485_c0_g1_i1.p1 TRINITY_DN32485_c0_g1~~TRINITY_DN32485_c0_g1_i1.p1  ORF type:complete len:903 (+),score=254.13 TRINITY_DN32485_c0_g1_i1:70-2709(+)
MPINEEEVHDYLSRHGIGTVLENALQKLVRERPADARMWLACHLAGDLNAESLVSRNMVLENNVADLEREIRRLKGAEPPRAPIPAPDGILVQESRKQQAGLVKRRTPWLETPLLRAFHVLLQKGREGQAAAAHFDDLVHGQVGGNEAETVAATMLPDSRDCLLVLGMQNDYLPHDPHSNKCGGRCTVAEGDLTVPSITALMESFAEERAAIVCCRDYHPSNHCSFTAQGSHDPQHCIAGSTGSHLYGEIAATMKVVLDDREKHALSGVCFKNFHPNDDIHSAIVPRPEMPSGPRIKAVDSLMPGTNWVDPTGSRVRVVVNADGSWGAEWPNGSIDSIASSDDRGGLCLIGGGMTVTVAEACESAILWSDGDVWTRDMAISITGASDLCSGIYDIVVGFTVNGMPLFQKEPVSERSPGPARWLYSTPRREDGTGGFWRVTDDRDDFAKGFGWLRGIAKNNGLLPHATTAWGYEKGRPDPGVSVTVEHRRHPLLRWSGAYFLNSAGLAAWDGLTDINAPPDPTALRRPLSLTSALQDEGIRRLFICGVPLERQVVETAVAAASQLQSKPDDPRVFIVLDSTRPSYVFGVGKHGGFLMDPASLAETLADKGVKVVPAVALLQRERMAALMRRTERGAVPETKASALFPKSLGPFMLRKVPAVCRGMRIVAQPTQLKDGVRNTVQPAQLKDGIYDLKHVRHLTHLWVQFGIDSTAVLSPSSDIPTAAPHKRLRYGIPLEADSVSFAYPVADFDKKLAESGLSYCFHDPEFAFPMFGGLVYFRRGDDGEEGQVLGCRAIMIPGNDMAFERPRKWPLDVLERVEQAGRFQKVTLGALKAMAPQVKNFVWLQPGEVDHAAHGAFGYTFQDPDLNCIFPVVDPDYS